MPTKVVPGINITSMTTKVNPIIIKEMMAIQVIINQNVAKVTKKTLII